jgi:hypothetical protein
MPISNTVTGPSIAAENLLNTASTKQSVVAATFHAVNPREVRHRKYTVPNMKHVTPTSVVTSDEWAAMLGSIV